MRIAAAVTVIVTVGTLVTGCSVAAAATAEAHTAGTAGTAAPTSAASALAVEVRRELAAMRTSHYQHRTSVDEKDGSFDYDCSGFVDYALGRVLPAALAALPVTTSTRPLAADIERHLETIGDSGADPWRRVPTVADLAPGDVVAWLATEDSNTDDTGHVMIVNGSPTPDPNGAGRWLVPVADSTVDPHGDDSRHDDETGLGTGTIGLVVDEHGHPTAFAWRGGISTRWHTTSIALGRPT